MNNYSKRVVDLLTQRQKDLSTHLVHMGKKSYTYQSMIDAINNETEDGKQFVHDTILVSLDYFFRNTKPKQTENLYTTK